MIRRDSPKQFSWNTVRLRVSVYVCVYLLKRVAVCSYRDDCEVQDRNTLLGLAEICLFLVCILFSECSLTAFSFLFLFLSLRKKHVMAVLYEMTAHLTIVADGFGL